MKKKGVTDFDKIKKWPNELCTVVESFCRTGKLKLRRLLYYSQMED